MKVVMMGGSGLAKELSGEMKMGKDAIAEVIGLLFMSRRQPKRE
mgnify:CR=1 FL=1